MNYGTVKGKIGLIIAVELSRSVRVE